MQNRGPQAVGTIPDQIVAAGETAAVDVSSHFRDPDGDVLSYTAASSNAGVVGADVSGDSVVVTALARGVVTVTVTARDAGGLVAQQRFQVTVPNRGPEAVEAIPAQTVFAGRTASVDVSGYFRDPDGDPLTYKATSSNADVATVTVSAATITIRAIASGVATMTVSASDPEGGAAQQTVQVTVPNRGPEAVGTIAAQTVPVGESKTVDVSSHFRDPDGDALSYTAASSNAGVVGADVSGDSVVVTALARGVATVTVTARDAGGLVAQQRFQVTVPNRGPEAVEAIPAQTVFAGRTASVDVSGYFRDPDGDPLTYKATSSNADVATVTVSAATITIRAIAPGVATMTVSASDPEGGAAQQTVQVTVPNRGPEAVGTIAAQTVPVGESKTVDVSSHFRDPDGDALSYTAASSNAGVVGADVSGDSVVVTALARGVATVTVTARDAGGLVAQQRFQVTVPNRGPEAVEAIPAQTVFAGRTASVDVSGYFRDPDGDPLTYKATSSNADVATVTVSAATITIRAIASGVATMTVSASDPEGGAAQQTVQVTVPNRGPEAVGTIAAQTVPVGESKTVDVSSYFRDPDGDALSYTAASSNAGVVGADVSGDSVVVTALARGVATVTVTARDAGGLVAQQRFQVTVPNRGPEAVEAIPAQTVFAGRTASVDVSGYFRDPDGDPLTYKATSSNADVATVTVSAATITIRAIAPGVATVTVNASDPAGGAAQQSVQVAVPNRAPEAVGEIPAQTVSAGETAALDMSPYFSDPDGDELSYTAASSNAGVVVAEVSGDSVVVTSLARGVAIVTVTARDPRGLAAQQRFRVTVANQAPEAVGEIPAQAVSAGETATVDVSPYFREPDGDALSHTASSSNAGVAGVEVSGSSVVVSALAGGMATVTVTARDPQGLAAQQRFQVTVPNQAPEAVGAIPAQAVPIGGTATVDVSPHFSDPDGDELSYDAASSNAEVAEVSVTGSSVAVAAGARGVATVTVTARDPGGLSASSSFAVNVSERGFQIELVFVTSVTRAQRAAFVRAAERWMTILAPTELPDFRANRTLTCGDDTRFARYVATIDELMILAAVGEIDGPGGTLARAAPCWIRSGSALPFYGRMEFDAADLERLEQFGAMEETILHEMGHVLGIGTIWDRLGLLRNPASDTEAPDTHFTGPLAIEAFDEAGGTGYGGAKVPVENTGGPGSRNSHWRETVLVAELMTPYTDLGVPEPLSAITIQSLADIGYMVDPTGAEPYRLPSADAARAMDPDRLIPYGDDIWRGPVVVVDPDGRIVRVIPGSSGGDRLRF
ncbi:Ig-like domain-containing protein [Candidatus Palauibacter sp.]|uniref:Ig-like domain-containing protein n=2 Tax=Candidatus Palauibacter sp. TaxID=3101350 RepID=UPI003AF2FAEE